MITSCIIKNNEDSPLYYLQSVFKNGREFHFSPGINIIIGRNGSGKSTLLRLLGIYSLCSNYIESNQRELNNDRLYNNYYSIDKERELHKGVEIYGDYKYSVFNLQNMTERNRYGDSLGLNHGFEGFGTMMQGKTSSNGENNILNFNFLFDRISNSKLEFPKTDIFDNWKVSCEKRVTILMDEPDKNLDVYNIEELFQFLDDIHQDFQIIAIIHNPLLIYKLSRTCNVNWIEISDGYFNKLTSEFDKK